MGRSTRTEQRKTKLTKVSTKVKTNQGQMKLISMVRAKKWQENATEAGSKETQDILGKLNTK